MSPEKDRLAREAAPSVWTNVPFQHDDGWFEIVRDLGIELAKLGAVVGQVKEKYARLVVYIHSPHPPFGTDAMQAAIRRATKKSVVTCETCGGPGRLVYSPALWESTLCEEHQGRSLPPEELE